MQNLSSNEFNLNGYPVDLNMLSCKYSILTETILHPALTASYIGYRIYCDLATLTVVARPFLSRVWSLEHLKIADHYI